MAEKAGGEARGQAGPKAHPPGNGAGGEHSAVWDQRDDAGRVVSAGLYFVRFEAAGSKLGQKVILIP